MSGLAEIRRRGGGLALPWTLVRSALRLSARKLRVIFFRHIHGMGVGRDVFLGPGITFVLPRRVQLDDRTSLAAKTRLWSESEDGYLHLHVGAQVNRGALLDFSGGLTLERDALVSAEAIVYTHDHGRDPHSEPAFSSLVIAEGAWVGTRAIVMPSVNYIGRNAVIGAGAVLTEDLPDGMTFVGAQGRLLYPSDHPQN